MSPFLHHIILKVQKSWRIWLILFTYVAIKIKHDFLWNLKTISLTQFPQHLFYLSQNIAISKDCINVFVRKYACFMKTVIFRLNAICGFYLDITRLIRTFWALALLAWFVVASPHFLGLYFDAPPFGWILLPIYPLR